MHNILANTLTGFWQRELSIFNFELDLVYPEGTIFSTQRNTNCRYLSSRVNSAAADTSCPLVPRGFASGLSLSST